MAAQRIEELFNRPASPVEELHGALSESAGLRLFVKRDDLLALSPGSAFCGNKWRKLKYNLLAAQEQGKRHLLTFGGAYSNHLAAVAEAAQALGFQSTGIVRGEEPAGLNPTLRLARACGMQLQYVSRTLYRSKAAPGFLERLGIDSGSVYMIPEGGTNKLALAGCRELAEEILDQLSPDYVLAACGTGGTLAGIITGLKDRCRVLGISVLKGDIHKGEVKKLLEAHQGAAYEHWGVLTNYHHGGYAKWTPELLEFIRNFRSDFGIALDPIYTGKLCYAVFDLIRGGYFPRGATLVAVHTGGLQGVAGFEERFGIKL